MNIAVVGAGDAFIKIFNYYNRIDKYNFIAIADPDEKASGIDLAKNKNITIYKDYNNMINSEKIDTLIELTGIDSLSDDVKKLTCDHNIDFISHIVARFMVTGIKKEEDIYKEEIIKISKKKINKATSKLKKSVEQIRETKNNTDDIMKDINVLNININIEASKLGAKGKPFLVIGDEMHDMLNEINNLLQDIGNIAQKNNEVVEILNKIENEVLNRLKTDI